MLKLNYLQKVSVPKINERETYKHGLRLRKKGGENPN